MAAVTTSSASPDIHAWLSTAHTASLATLLKDPRAPGTPYATAVPYALADADGTSAWRVVVFISELAVHTKNLRADARASLLVSEPGRDHDPWGGWRVTLVGHMQILEGTAADHALAAFRARHAATAGGAQQLPHDFSPWALHVDATRYIAGFGRMGWL